MRNSGKRRALQAVVGVLAIVFVSPLELWAQSSAKLALKVSGTITASPVWQNAGGAAITHVLFSFAGKVAGTKPNVDVDSSPQTVRLVNVNAYPANVTLLRPGNCTIGAIAVDDKHVLFLNNGKAISNNSNMAIPNSSLQSYAIRFSAAGHYGDKSGTVECAKSGALTYTY